MKDFKKDVLRICKGHYSARYKTKFEAIKTYQANWSGSDVKYISDVEVFRFISLIADEFFTAKDYKAIILDRIVRDLEYKPLCGETFTLSVKTLADAYIGQLCSLQVKDGEKWIIDLSDYPDNEISI